jgi:hypothetical protein
MKHAVTAGPADSIRIMKNLSDYDSHLLDGHHSLSIDSRAYNDAIFFDFTAGYIISYEQSIVFLACKMIYSEIQDVQNYLNNWIDRSIPAAL